MMTKQQISKMDQTRTGSNMSSPGLPATRGMVTGDALAHQARSARSSRSNRNREVSKHIKYKMKGKIAIVHVLLLLVATLFWEAEAGKFRCPCGYKGMMRTKTKTCTICSIEKCTKKCFNAKNPKCNSCSAAGETPQQQSPDSPEIIILKSDSQCARRSSLSTLSASAVKEMPATPSSQRRPTLSRNETPVMPALSKVEFNDSEDQPTEADSADSGDHTITREGLPDGWTRHKMTKEEQDSRGYEFFYKKEGQSGWTLVHPTTGVSIVDRRRLAANTHPVFRRLVEELAMV